MAAPQQLSGFNNQVPLRYPIKTITSAYSISAADYGVILNCTPSASMIVSLPHAASVGAGFNCWVWNNPASAVVYVQITPGAGTIDGAANVVLYSSAGTQIVSDGQNWQTVAKKSMRLYAESSVPVLASASRPSAQGSNAVAIGQAAISSGSSSFALGQSSNAGASYAYAMGLQCNASQLSSYSLGYQGVSNVSGKFAFASPGLGSLGQWANLPLCIQTTNATATVLTSDLGAASATNQLLLAANSAVVFCIYVVARQQAAGGTASAAWKIEGIIRQEGTAATTTLVGTPTVTAISNVPAWAVAVSADTTLGCLKVTVTGAAATNIQWMATAYSSETSYT